MNLDPSKAVGNGNVASSSNVVSPKSYLANGLDRSFSYSSNEFSFPPGGISSLRLPTVVVHISIYSIPFLDHLDCDAFCSSCWDVCVFGPLLLLLKMVLEGGNKKIVFG